MPLSGRMFESVETLRVALRDRLQLDRELGRGGMGTVYRAQDLRHRRPVAVKVLNPAISAALGAERFEREIEIVARLSHPHIVPLIDSGEVDGIRYFVMPLIEGESLRARLHHEPQLPIDEAIRITRQIADALAYAGAAGIVHRDIKPENILLSRGHAFLTDFGIARAAIEAGGAAITASGLALGTPAYASPEQLLADRTLDARSDIFSLGCVLFEMLAGEPPFGTGSAHGILARQLTGTVPSLGAFRGTAPRWLEAVIQRAMAQAAADRFSTATELIAALDSSGASIGAPGRTPSIAVLPFANLSSEPDADWFSDGMTEEILTSLSRIPSLRVAARTSSFAFKGQSADVRRIGEQLGVATVLEGSVRRAGGRLRVSAQLIDVANGYQLWSERFDRDLQDVFAIQDEIAGRIAQSLAGVLGGAPSAPSAERAPTADLEAYDLYLRARDLFHQFRRKQFERARELLRAAVRRDPRFARAWAGIANASSYLYTTFDATTANAAAAEEASRRAVELAPELGEARTARGYALAINRRFEEAWPEFEAAATLSPRDFDTWYLSARAHWQAGHLEEAARRFERAADVRPEDFQSIGLAATAYDALHDRINSHRCNRAAIDRVERWLDLYPNDTRALYMGALSHLRLGNREQGMAGLRRAADMDPDDPATMYNIACGFAIAGDVEKAIDCLERCYAMGFAHHDWIAHDVDLDSLRQHPRFHRLLSQHAPAS